MSEQKYYVRINKKLWNNLNPLQLGGVSIDLYPDEYGYGEYFIAEYEPESVYCRRNKNYFTKSELAEIMDGAFYKQCDDPDNCLIGRMDCRGEWVNPLIELLLVEGSE